MFLEYLQIDNHDIITVMGPADKPDKSLTVERLATDGSN